MSIKTWRAFSSTLPLLSYRLLLEAASGVLQTPALQSFFATLLRQDAVVYNPVIAGQLMANREVMSCLGMAPVITSRAEVASLDGDGTQPVLIDCHVSKDSQPVELQAAIITEKSLVSLLSYRLLLEAASEALPTLAETPALQYFVATLLRQDAGVYNPVIAGQLMAIPEVMSCLGMAPVITSRAGVASLDDDDTEPDQKKRKIGPLKP